MPPRRWGAQPPAGDSASQAERSPRFAALLIAQLPRLRRYATAWLGNAADADDLVQDCLERAIERQATLQHPERIGSWLLSILHNLHISGIRSGRSRGRSVGLDHLEQNLLFSVPAADAGRMRDFARAFAQLSEEHRQVLLLLALEGLSYREIAEILDVPMGTVMSRLARARERLRALLEGGNELGVRRIK